MKFTLKIILVLICTLSLACSKEEAAEVTPKIVSDKSATSIAGTTAKFGGNIYWEEGFTLTKRGVCYSTTANPTIANTCAYAANGTGIFYCSLTNLKIGTKYYIRAFATYLNGKSYYGDIATFTTTKELTMANPTFDFNSRTSVTFTDSIPGDGGYSITARGVCYSTSPNPTYTDNDHTTDGTGPGKYTSTFTVLDGKKTYYARPYFVNAVGTYYGQEVTFTTFPLAPTTGENEVADIDGNIYHTIKIGNQVWMVENLRTTHYKNGGIIPTCSGDIYNETNPKYQWVYNNISENIVPYGRLYTLSAGMDDRGIAPEGWRIPSSSDLSTLIGTIYSLTYLTEDQYTNYYYAIALCSKSYWTNSTTIGSPGYDATSNNSSGLSLVPGGLASGGSNFSKIGEYGCYMTTYVIEGFPYALVLRNNSYSLVLMSIMKYYGVSIRCIKN
jgi:uncharacterized protein (TIGR02145 family)